MEAQPGESLCAGICGNSFSNIDSNLTPIIEEIFESIIQINSPDFNRRVMKSHLIFIPDFQ